jgi:MYXO-CTERM domain-containing protein
VAVAAGTDPDEECAGTGQCGGTCDGNRACAFPGNEVGCGLCSVCDGVGACGAKPADDPACGTIACSALSSTCRAYTDLNANRCADVSVCATVDVLHCTAYTDAPASTTCSCAGGGTGTCQDGACHCDALDGGVDGPAPADAAAEDAPVVPVDAAGPGADAGGPAPKSSGCGCAAAPGGAGLLALVGGLLLLPLRRRRSRR